ncbi:hypothetical protein C8R44DRAFT_895235 [Mycena epipterygia]|nr:hypothetical protein C8R44DRAFT_895235 [Mycena epipterygia]
MASCGRRLALKAESARTPTPQLVVPLTGASCVGVPGPKQGVSLAPRSYRSSFAGTSCVSRLHGRSAPEQGTSVVSRSDPSSFARGSARGGFSTLGAASLRLHPEAVARLQEEQRSHVERIVLAARVQVVVRIDIHSIEYTRNRESMNLSSLGEDAEQYIICKVYSSLTSARPRRAVPRHRQTPRSARARTIRGKRDSRMKKAHFSSPINLLQREIHFSIDLTSFMSHYKRLLGICGEIQFSNPMPVISYSTDRARPKRTSL